MMKDEIEKKNIKKNSSQTELSWQTRDLGYKIEITLQK
jgi:hypothetical protein